MARAKPQLAASDPASSTNTTACGAKPEDSNPTSNGNNVHLNKAMEGLHLRPSCIDSSAINMDFPETMMAAEIRSKLAQEETALEDMIVDLILDGQWEILQPNSGKSIVLGDGKSVSVGYNEELGSGYRTWEWHGHVMVYEDGEGYVPEYIYGNYFEPLEEEDEFDLSSMNPVIGLGGIISGVERRAPSKAL